MYVFDVDHDSFVFYYVLIRMCNIEATIICIHLHFRVEVTR